jgi:hypothetical protein
VFPVQDRPSTSRRQISPSGNHRARTTTSDGCLHLARAGRGGLEHDDTDARRRVLSAVVQRRGQQRFRRIVLAAYNGACAITGSKAEPVLEAAHIDPYSGDHTQHVTNGLLLRSDLHTLFDLHLITVTAGKLVAVSPRLRGTDYAAMNRQRLKLPGRVCASACQGPRETARRRS